MSPRCSCKETRSSWSYRTHSLTASRGLHPAVRNHSTILQSPVLSDGSNTILCFFFLNTQINKILKEEKMEAEGKGREGERERTIMNIPA